jgi:hypothetical protein
VLLEPLQTAGPLRSTDITLLRRYYGPLRHPLAGPRLPGVAGYTVPFSADFATGRGGLLQLLGASLPSCCRCNPARVSRPISQSANDPCCLRPMKKGSAPGIPFRGYVCVDSLRPDDSLTILAMASSIGSRDSVSFLLTIQATGLLTFTLVGLPPTEIRQPSLDTPTCRFIPAHPQVGLEPPALRLTRDALRAAGKARHGWDPGCAENRGILAREAGMVGFLGGQKQREFDLLSGAWAATCV